MNDVTALTPMGREKLLHAVERVSEDLAQIAFWLIEENKSHLVSADGLISQALGGVSALVVASDQLSSGKVPAYKNSADVIRAFNDTLNRAPDVFEFRDIKQDHARYGGLQSLGWLKKQFHALRNDETYTPSVSGRTWMRRMVSYIPGQMIVQGRYTKLEY